MRDDRLEFQELFLASTKRIGFLGCCLSLVLLGELLAKLHSSILEHLLEFIESLTGDFRWLRTIGERVCRILGQSQRLCKGDAHCRSKSGSEKSYLILGALGSLDDLSWVGSESLMVIGKPFS